jgi:NDP-sugar pyrophosphorylase family protein
MEAMILAAGLGTRLAPLTDRMPKALVPVRGRPLIAHVLDRLVEAGVTRVVVNTSRFGEAIEAWLAAHVPPGVEWAVSPEPDGPYDTGGGLMHAAPLFRGEGPIILHAVDVLSQIPLADMHAPGALATLAVQDRPSSRQLLFDDVGLMGSWDRRVREPVGGFAAVRELAFTGIHAIEPALLRLATRRGTFPIRELYLDLAEQGHIIRAYDVSDHPCRNVGTPARLAEAEGVSW